MKYQDLPNKEGEILSLEDEKLQNMIGDLKRVDAPKDFDFRLKARIANARSSDFQPRFLPVLRYVLPLSAILVIFALVVLNGLYFPDSQAVSKVVEVVPKVNNEQESLPILPTVVEPSGNITNIPKDEKLVVEDIPAKPEQAKSEKAIKPSVNDSQVVAVKSPTITPKKNLVVKIEDDDGGGGSRDSAVSDSPVITPNGINLNSTPKNPAKTENLQSLNTQEVLSQLGIGASFIDAGWIVKSVKQNSLAELSGVKAGDVVEAIDGEKLTNKPLSKIDGKTLTVVRGAEKIEISLRINK